MRDFEAQLNYNLGKKISLVVQYQNISKIPNHNFNLHQSSYNRYNWNNDFNNEKSNALSGSILSPFGKAEVQMMTLKDHLYFSNDTIGDYQQYITPKQYAGTINYLSLKYSKELKYKKWALDNTLLYQKVVQNEAILNVPQFVLRHTLYYSKQVFQKAMFLQTGVSCNYFTSYYAEDYNPVLGEFFVQNTKKIGSFPMLDFFVNACVKQTRIYLKAEHFNSSFTGNKFYAAPSIPYHDFMIRFGLVWNFFQ
jgi:hypothetical protein